MAAEAQFWDNLAEDYARKPVSNLPAYQRKLVATKARLRPDDVVLDVGCGTGSLALELAPHVRQVHAMDLSSGMIDIAKRKATAAGVDNVTFHTSTLDGPAALPPASLDMVCAYNILHLVDDRHIALRSIFALLKPGGSLVSSTPCLGQSYVPYRLILPVLRWLGKAPAVEVFNVAQLDAALTESGFTQLQHPDVGAGSHTAFVLATKPG